jgi:hypothetical protein
MKTKLVKISVFFIFVLIFGCSSTPDPDPTATFSKKFKNDFENAQKAIYDEYCNDDIIIWHKGSEFISLDMNNTCHLTEVKIEIDEGYPGGWVLYGQYSRNYSEFHISLSFIDKNENRNTVNLSTSYSGNYKDEFSRDLLKWIKKYYFIFITDVTTKTILDTADNTYLLVYNDNLRTIYNDKVVKTEEQNKRRESIFGIIGKKVPDDTMEVEKNKYYTKSSFTRDGKLSVSGMYYFTDNNKNILQIKNWESTGDNNYNIASYLMNTRANQFINGVGATRYRTMGDIADGNSENIVRLECDEYRISIEIERFDQHTLCIITNIWKNR